MSREHVTQEALPDPGIGQRARVLLLLDAAERAGITPLPTAAVHSLAYLADVLSPVWSLPAFTAEVLKQVGGPFYRDLQTELDRLVVQGLVEVEGLSYVDRPRGGARIDGRYSLCFSAPQLAEILGALGARSEDEALDPRDCRIYTFLVQLASAFATLSPDEMDRAAIVDVTWREAASANNLLDMDRSSEFRSANLSVATADRFSDFVPSQSKLNPSEKVYLYASYLRRRAHGG